MEFRFNAGARVGDVIEIGDFRFKVIRVIPHTSEVTMSKVQPIKPAPAREESRITQLERELIQGQAEERELASALYEVRAANRLKRAELQNLVERV